LLFGLLRRRGFDVSILRFGLAIFMTAHRLSGMSCVRKELTLTRPNGLHF
jgi:hypothetical protein